MKFWYNTIKAENELDPNNDVHTRKGRFPIMIPKLYKRPMSCLLIGLSCGLIALAFRCIRTQCQRAQFSIGIWSRSPNFNLVHNKINMTHTQGIPKIIHQIWNNEFIPEVFQENIRGLVGHNRPPEWKYFFWTLSSGRKFIDNNFPKLFRRFSKADNLLKADILRLAVLYHYGGVYFDLDTVSVKPLAPYVETHNCSFTTDPPEHVFKHDRKNRGQIITNSVILCKPGNSFILHVIELLSNQSDLCKDAVACTGPGIITKQYEILQANNRSRDLPFLENYQLFEDKITGEHKFQAYLIEHCVDKFDELKYEWSENICREFLRRGGLGRKISEKAYTYHTWFHVNWYPKKIAKGVKKIITEIVSQALFYQG